jgi:hypothetical protein
MDFKYFITFDLEDAGQAYDRIYQWVHRYCRGYRYFRFPSGRWGYLPATSVVVTFSEKEAATSVEAGDRFREILTDPQGFNLVITRLAVTRGEPDVVVARAVDSPPDWLRTVYPMSPPRAIEI